MKTQTTNTVATYYSETIRSMIDKENDSVNHRITWLITIQGLFFATLGFSWDKPKAIQLIQVLSLLGIAISILVFFALLSATNPRGQLCNWWGINKPKDYSGPDVIGLTSILKHPILRYFTFWNWIPLLFIIAWLSVWYLMAV